MNKRNFLVGLAGSAIIVSTKASGVIFKDDFEDFIFNDSFEGGGVCPPVFAKTIIEDLNPISEAISLDEYLNNPNC